jgi:5-hydroxyisourate hydrolase
MTVSLSTHVLDTATGGPAEGVRVEVRSAGGDLLAEATTDADGRARLAEGLEPQLYRIVFEPPSPFFRKVELSVELEEGHYHVPLLFSPYACATYRGS